jgi:hypothetical protein
MDSFCTKTCPFWGQLSLVINYFFMTTDTIRSPEHFVHVPKWGVFLIKHASFWGVFFKFRESRDTGRMGAWECLRSERTQSLTCTGGQGARARDVRFILHGP